MEDENEGDWGGAVAHAGELEVFVLTRRAMSNHAVLRGAADEDTELLTLVFPDDAKGFALAHTSVEGVMAFLENMRPHTVTIIAGRGEDPSPLRETLRMPGVNEVGPRAEEVCQALLARLAAAS